MKVTPSQLKRSKKNDLVQLAKKLVGTNLSRKTKQDIIDIILNKLSATVKTATKTAPTNGSVSEVKTSFSTANPLFDGGPSSGSSAPYQAQPVPSRNDGVPDCYGVSRIVLMVRDPYWLHTYWELTQQRVNEVRTSIDPYSRGQARLALKVIDITDTDAQAPNSSYYIHLTDFARNWYLNVPNDDCMYCVEIGFLLPDGRFYMIERSNTVRTPRDGMSNVFDEEWMSIEDYNRLYALSGGLSFGLSSFDTVHNKGELLKRSAASESMFSSGMPVGEFHRSVRSKDLFLTAETEVVLYGKTQPGAIVKVEGINKRVAKDGSFSIRLHLPQGRHVIPVQAVSSDGKIVRDISIDISKGN